MKRAPAQRKGSNRDQYDPAAVYALVTSSDFGFVFSNDDSRMLKPSTLKRARQAWPKYRHHIIERIKNNDLELPGFGWLPRNAAERLTQSLEYFGVTDV